MKYEKKATLKAIKSNKGQVWIHRSLSNEVLSNEHHSKGREEKKTNEGLSKKKTYVSGLHSSKK